MKHFPRLERNIPLRQAFTDLALTHPEAFRRDAGDALRLFIPRERLLIRQLNRATPDALHFFDAWNDQLKEVRVTLARSRDDKTFHRQLAKHLVLPETQATTTATHLFTRRDEQLVADFLSLLYSAHTRQTAHAETAARRILRYHDDHIQSIFEHYVSATIARDVAAIHDIAITDPHSRRWQRWRTRRRIKHQQRRQRRLDDKTRRHLARERKRLSLQQHGLVAAIDQLSMPFITITAAKSRFDKAVAKKINALDETGIIRATLFEEYVKQLRVSFLSTLDSSLGSADIAQRLARFNSLLDAIWRLSQEELNRIMTTLKQLREIDEQRANLDHRQALRDEILA